MTMARRSAKLLNVTNGKRKNPQAMVQLDPEVVQRIRVRAAELQTTIKALFHDAVRIAGKTDPRFRFDEPRGKR